MAITAFGNIQLSIRDLATIVSAPNDTAATLGISASQPNAAMTNALITGGSSPFFGLPLTYTSGASITPTDNVTLALAAGSRTCYNARRLAAIIDRQQNVFSSGFLPNAINGLITEAP